MAVADTIRRLFAQGLGELYVLHYKHDKPLMGQLYFEKGKLTLRDQGLLTGMTLSQLKPCWETGLIGMISGSKGKEWNSMTFYGLEYCDLPQDLGKTRHGALVAAQNQYGESLIDFVGSVYRGYQLMMEHHFLPVVVMQEVRSREGEIGLGVSDLRTVPMSISLIRKLNGIAYKSVERQLTMEVDDEAIEASEFEQLFGTYLHDK